MGNAWNLFSMKTGSFDTDSKRWQICDWQSVTDYQRDERSDATLSRICGITLINIPNRTWTKTPNPQLKQKTLNIAWMYARVGYFIWIYCRFYFNIYVAARMFGTLKKIQNTWILIILLKDIHQYSTQVSKISLMWYWRKCQSFFIHQLTHKWIVLKKF
jgi:hypothetical protein